MPSYTTKSKVQQLFETLKSAGIRQMVICPGSRNAPLIIQATATCYFELFSIPDERVAAFFALGLAESSQLPVPVVTTSGSAVLNLSPALSEAFYRNISLIAVTADRPAHLIHNGDGQSIDQKGVFKNFILAEYHISDDEILDQQKIDDLYRDLIHRRGPVQINMSFDEPLYETTSSLLPSQITHAPAAVKENSGITKELAVLEHVQQKSHSVVLLVGQGNPSHELKSVLRQWVEKNSVVLIAENLGNISSLGIQHAYLFDIALSNSASLVSSPDLLIQIGGPIVSKRLKQHFRSHPPKCHYYISSAQKVPNMFGCLTKHIQAHPLEILEVLNEISFAANYQKKWMEWHDKAEHHLTGILQTNNQWNDLKVYQILNRRIPPSSVIHWGNSSPVRYANFFSWPSQTHTSNRGVSGIDGCISTAIGHAYNHPGVLHFLVIGDVSFFYDSNAFWLNPRPNNLKIILINNGGGNIFDLIKGAKNLPKTRDLQFTEHQYDARHICSHYGLNYVKAENQEEFEAQWQEFFEHDDISVLEATTDPSKNAEVYARIFKFNGIS